MLCPTVDVTLVQLGEFETTPLGDSDELDVILGDIDKVLGNVDRVLVVHIGKVLLGERCGTTNEQLDVHVILFDMEPAAALPPVMEELLVAAVKRAERVRVTRRLLESVTGVNDALSVSLIRSSIDADEGDDVADKDICPVMLRSNRNFTTMPGAV
jgi:hypothetical protein